MLPKLILRAIGVELTIGDLLNDLSLRRNAIWIGKTGDPVKKLRTMTIIAYPKTILDVGQVLRLVYP